MTELTDWDGWRGSWQTQEPTSQELHEALARFQRAKRRDSIIRVIEWGIIVLAVAFPIVAVRHAANFIEATLGIGTAVVVLGGSAFRAWNRRAERTALGASVREFDDALRSLCRAELRFVRFLWFVLAVEGVFATVWWYGGLAVHDLGFAPVAIAMLWLPLAIVVATLIWSLRLNAAARRELDALAVRESAGQIDNLR